MIAHVPMTRKSICRDMDSIQGNKYLRQPIKGDTLRYSLMGHILPIQDKRGRTEDMTGGEHAQRYRDPSTNTPPLGTPYGDPDGQSIRRPIPASPSQDPQIGPK